MFYTYVPYSSWYCFKMTEGIHVALRRSSITFILLSPYITRPLKRFATNCSCNHFAHYIIIAHLSITLLLHTFKWNALHYNLSSCCNLLNVLAVLHSDQSFPAKSLISNCLAKNRSNFLASAKFRSIQRGTFFSLLNFPAWVRVRQLPASYATMVCTATTKECALQRRSAHCNGVRTATKECPLQRRSVHCNEGVRTATKEFALQRRSAHCNEGVRTATKGVHPSNQRCALKHPKVCTK